MSKELDSIDHELTDWLHRQHVFFVATAPLSQQGHINCSPKGGDCFRVLGPREVAYLDFTGSGAETVAHLRENGRIVLMFCAFEGRPNVVRLHGDGKVVLPVDAAFDEMVGLFPQNPGARAIIKVSVSRISSSCGFSIPHMEFQQDRDVLDKWAASKGPNGLKEYRHAKNSRSIDGLPTVASYER